MSGHVIGWPVGITAYRKAGCRCEGCTTAVRDEQRRVRANPEHQSPRIYHKAGAKAQKWVRHNHPDEWRRMLDEARAEVEAEHGPLRKRGWPRKQVTP